MATKYWIMLICAVLVGASWGGYTIGNRKAVVEVSLLTLPSPSPQQEFMEAPNSAEQGSILQDRDYLLQKLAIVHDSYEGFEYSEPKLQELQANPENKDYRKVLQQFARSRLNNEIATFQTIGKPVNPRTLLITTKDQLAYMVYMRKDYSHDGIWLVSGFKDYRPQGSEISEIYKIIPLAQAPGEVKEWAQALLELPEWKKEYRNFGDRTYVLIKSSSSYSDSVELENVTAFAGEVNISYQSYQYAPNSEKELLNDYLLFELLVPSIREVNFQNSYSNFPLIAGKEPAPGDESTIAHLKSKIVLDAKFMELAAGGKIRGIEFGIGSKQDEVIAKWGKPHEIGSRQVEFQRWYNYQIYFWPPDNFIGAIRVIGESLAYTLPDIKKALGNPLSEGEGVDGGWSLYYRSGDYELYFNAPSKEGSAESLLLKKKP